MIKDATTKDGWDFEGELGSTARASSIIDDTIATITGLHIVAVGKVKSGFNSKVCKADSKAARFVACKMQIQKYLNVISANLPVKLMKIE